jgi:hypothetical protein
MHMVGEDPTDHCLLIFLGNDILLIRAILLLVHTGAHCLGVQRAS